MLQVKSKGDSAGRISFFLVEVSFFPLKAFN